MPCPPHPPWLDNTNYTWRRVQVMKLLTMQFSPTSNLFIHLWCKCSLSTLFSNTLSLCSFINVRDQVSHPYRTTGKIIVSYILIFMLLDRILWLADPLLYGLDDRKVGVQVSAGSRIFSSPRFPDRLWGPPSFLSNVYRGLFLRR
jgi:hypothetical protein